MKQFRILISVFLLFASVTFAPAAEQTNAFIGWVGAAGSVYNGSASTQPMDINVSSNAGNSQVPVVKMDSRGYPTIVWQD
ncbi:MAG: hypothetical protein KA140_07990, partial [Caldisericia bacterium]|nr:hypothetical protein [Caldisericia bacterium]